MSYIGIMENARTPSLASLGFEQKDIKRLQTAFLSSDDVDCLVDCRGGLWTATLMCGETRDQDFFELEMVKTGQTCDVYAKDLF